MNPTKERLSGIKKAMSETIKMVPANGTDVALKNTLILLLKTLHIVIWNVFGVIKIADKSTAKDVPVIPHLTESG